LVSPIDGHTKLQLEKEGLDLIRSLEGPLSPVVVIGPYRSGKSFLLNQLLGVGCGEAPTLAGNSLQLIGGLGIAGAVGVRMVYSGTAGKGGYRRRGACRAGLPLLGRADSMARPATSFW